MEQEVVKQGCFASVQDLLTNVLAFIDSLWKNAIVNTSKGGKISVRETLPAFRVQKEPCNPDQG